MAQPIKLLALRTLVPVMGFGLGGAGTWFDSTSGADMTLDPDTGAVTLRRTDGALIEGFARSIVVAAAGVGWYAPAWADKQADKRK